MHTLTGKIRKAPYTKQGQNQNGEWKMYAIELSEAIKDRQSGEKSYTNYRATIFAKAGGQMQFYDSVIVEGAVVSVSCEKLKVDVRDGNDRQFITLEMVDAKITFAEAPQSNQHQQQQQIQQPKQQVKQQKPQQTMDDDIPF